MSLQSQKSRKQYYPLSIFGHNTEVWVAFLTSDFVLYRDAFSFTWILWLVSEDKVIQ